MCDRADRLLVCFVFLLEFSPMLCSLAGHPRNLAWTGGPLHSECESTVDFFTRAGYYVRENVVAIKAIAFKDEIYVVTPRWKPGVLSSLWQVERGRGGVELDPYPEQRAHAPGDCGSVQNAVDATVDHKGTIWILDSGMIETMVQPRCTCRPKVVAVSTLKRKISRRIELTAEPTSLLQTIVVEYNFGKKPHVYVSDASRGAILVYDTSSGSQWSVVACAPAPGLQMVLVRRAPTHHVLVLVRLHSRGLIELDTAALRRKNSLTALRVFGEHSKAVVLLGSDHHRVYFRHAECADVLSWDAREPYNSSSSILDIHSAGPRLTPTSATADMWKHVILVLDSNYADTVGRNSPTYHRITFIGQL